jgi:hypothetical protein
MRKPGQALVFRAMYHQETVMRLPLELSLTWSGFKRGDRRPIFGQIGWRTTCLCNAVMVAHPVYWPCRVISNIMYPKDQAMIDSGIFRTVPGYFSESLAVSPCS